MTLQELLDSMEAQWLRCHCLLHLRRHQNRNNPRAVRAAAFQNLERQTRKLDELARNDELCCLILHGGHDFELLDRVEKARFRIDTWASCNASRTPTCNTTSSTNWESDLASLQSMLETVLSVPGRRVAWRLMIGQMSPEFRTYVDEWYKGSCNADDGIAAWPSRGKDQAEAQGLAPTVGALESSP